MEPTAKIENAGRSLSVAPAAVRRKAGEMKRGGRRTIERVDRERRVGLARAVSKMGLCSRARAAELIRAGRVRLNGEPCRNPEAPVRMTKDRVELDGERVKAGDRVYLMMNKPRGVVTTASDEKRRETIYALLKRGTPWVAPVGRLDMASEGLLLMTNDSEWGAGIAEAESHVDKRYHVQIATLATEELVMRLQGGVQVQSAEGEREVLRAKRAAILRHGEKNSWLEIVLDEGKNRQIRRMLEAMGIEVLRLIRVSIGPVQLGRLAKGEVRELTKEEIRLLDARGGLTERSGRER